MFLPLAGNGRPLVPSEEDSMICGVLLLYIAEKVSSQYREIVPRGYLNSNLRLRKVKLLPILSVCLCCRSHLKCAVLFCREKKLHFEFRYSRYVNN